VVPSVHQSHRATRMRSRHTDTPDNTILEPRRLWLGVTESVLVGTEKKSSEALNCRGISCNRPVCLAVMLPCLGTTAATLFGTSVTIVASITAVACHLPRTRNWRSRQGRARGQRNSAMVRPLLRKHSFCGDNRWADGRTHVLWVNSWQRPGPTI
jgi:hypothetical protein